MVDSVWTGLTVLPFLSFFMPIFSSFNFCLCYFIHCIFVDYLACLNWTIYHTSWSYTHILHSLENHGRIKIDIWVTLDVCIPVFHCTDPALNHEVFFFLSFHLQQVCFLLGWKWRQLKCNVLFARTEPPLSINEQKLSYSS